MDFMNTLIAKSEYKMPIYIDVSHIVGNNDKFLMLDYMKDYIEKFGSYIKGFMIETHCNLDEAITDRKQQINPYTLAEIIREVNKH